MHHGVFCGKNASAQSKRILILGESHHGEQESTTSVVKNYWANYCENSTGRDKAYRFFENIVRTFGIDPELYRIDFWDSVYFGNYVETSCGIGNELAKKAVKLYRNSYNGNLFRFIQENEIDMVFCFSRLVFNNLPPVDKPDLWISDGSDSHRLESRTYSQVNIPDGEVITLDKPVTVYGLRHPSRGYSWKKYLDRITRIAADALSICHSVADNA